MTVHPQEVGNFHALSDVDASHKSQHHTLGLKSSQASPGNHTHDGKNSRPAAFIGALAERSAVQAINNAAFTAVNFNVNLLDTNNFHNGTKFTAVFAGVYRLVTTNVWDANGVGIRSIAYALNGTQLAARYGGQRMPGAPAAVAEYLTTVFETKLVIGDYLEVLCHQTSGGALNLTEAYASFTYMGPA